MLRTNVFTSNEKYTLIIPTKLTARFKQDCFVDSCPISAGVIHPHSISRVFTVIENCAERHNFGARVVKVLSRIAR
jgi:hypothetical protein